MSDDKPQRSADPRIGTLLGERFRVEALLGKGGMGSVYRAEHIHMRKTVAVKVLHREMTGLDEIVKRFEREAIAAGRIEHPNVAAALDFGQLPDGSFYLALEYVPGESLREVLAASGPIPVRRALGIARQVASALTAAHAVDIVHRDLKPDNVMLIEKGDAKDLVKVLDFGIAKVAGAQPAGTLLTQIGTVFGTPQYMAPEQAAGQTVDHRADLYALGLILHEMLRGRPTFECEELIGLITMQLTADPPALPSEIPADVRELVTRMLDKSPAARPASAAEVVNTLGESIQRIDARAAGSPKPARGAGGAATAAIAERGQQAFDRARPLVLRAGKGIAVLGKRRIAGKVPVWAVAAVVVLALTAWAWLKPDDSPVRAEHRSPGTPATTSDPADDTPDEQEPTSGAALLDSEMENLIKQASRGDPGAVRQLQPRAAAARSPRVWLAIARGLIRRRDGGHDVASALDAFRRAIELDAGVADDSTMLSGLAYYARRDETSSLVFDFAIEHMGASGADLIFYVWSSTSEKTPATQRAGELLTSRAVKGEMSKALTLALEVRNASGCDEFRDLLPKLRDAGDERSFLPMRDLAKTTGCGPDGREDCYQCLRDNSLLKDALTQVQLRKAPLIRRWRR